MKEKLDHKFKKLYSFLDDKRQNLCRHFINEPVIIKLTFLDRCQIVSFFEITPSKKNFIYSKQEILFKRKKYKKNF